MFETRCTALAYFNNYRCTTKIDIYIVWNVGLLVWVPLIPLFSVVASWKWCLRFCILFNFFCWLGFSFLVFILGDMVTLSTRNPWWHGESIYRAVLVTWHLAFKVIARNTCTICCIFYFQCFSTSHTMSLFQYYLGHKIWNLESWLDFRSTILTTFDVY